MKFFTAESPFPPKYCVINPFSNPSISVSSLVIAGRGLTVSSAFIKSTTARIAGMTAVSLNLRYASPTTPPSCVAICINTGLPNTLVTSCSCCLYTVKTPEPTTCCACCQKSPKFDVTTDRFCAIWSPEAPYSR